MDDDKQPQSSYDEENSLLKQQEAFRHFSFPIPVMLPFSGWLSVEGERVML